MATSFIKKVLVKDQGNNNNPYNSFSLEELDARISDIVTDIDDTERTIDTASGVVREVETQNELIEQHVQDGGEISPLSQSMIQSTRRVASIGMVGEVEDDTTRDFINQASVESLTSDQIQLSLEDAKKFLSKVKYSIVEGIRKFIELFKKMFSMIMSTLFKRNELTTKQIIEFFNKHDEKSIQEAIKNIKLDQINEKCKGYYLADTNGSVVDFHDVVMVVTEEFFYWLEHVDSTDPLKGDGRKSSFVGWKPFKIGANKVIPYFQHEGKEISILLYKYINKIDEMKSITKLPDPKRLIEEFQYLCLDTLTKSLKDFDKAREHKFNQVLSKIDRYANIIKDTQDQKRSAIIKNYIEDQKSAMSLIKILFHYLNNTHREFIELFKLTKAQLEPQK